MNRSEKYDVSSVLRIQKEYNRSTAPESSIAMNKRQLKILLKQNQPNNQQLHKIKINFQKNQAKTSALHKQKLHQQNFIKAKSQRASLANDKKQLRCKTITDEPINNEKQLIYVFDKKTTKSAVNKNQEVQNASKGSKKLNVKELNTKSCCINSSYLPVNDRRNKKNKKKSVKHSLKQQQSKPNASKKQRNKSIKTQPTQSTDAQQKNHKKSIKSRLFLQQLRLIKKFINHSQELSQSFRGGSSISKSDYNEIQIQKQIKNYLNSIDVRVLKQMRQDCMNSEHSENHFSSVNSVQVDYVNLLTEVKKVRMEVLVEAAVKIQRFWRKMLRKNVFREYRYIFQNIMHHNELKSNSKNLDYSENSQFFMRSGESVSELTLEKQQSEKLQYLAKQQVKPYQINKKIIVQEIQEQQQCEEKSMGIQQNIETTSPIVPKVQQVCVSPEESSNSLNPSEEQFYLHQNIDFSFLSLNLKSQLNNIEEQNYVVPYDQCEQKEAQTIQNIKQSTVLNNSPNEMSPKSENGRNHGEALKNAFDRKEIECKNQQTTNIVKNVLGRQSMAMSWDNEPRVSKKEENLYGIKNINDKYDENLYADELVSQKIYRIQLKTEQNYNNKKNKSERLANLGRINEKNKQKIIYNNVCQQQHFSDRQSDTKQNNQRIDNISEFVLLLLITQFLKQIDAMVHASQQKQANHRYWGNRKKLRYKQIYLSNTEQLYKSQEIQNISSQKSINGVRTDEKSVNLYLQLIIDIVLSSESYVEQVYENLQKPINPFESYFHQGFKIDDQPKINKSSDQQQESDDGSCGDSCQAMIPYEIHVQAFKHVKSLLQSNGFQNSKENLMALSCWISCLYDCFNECLDDWRPAGNIPQTVFWKVKTKGPLFLFKQQHLPYILQSTHEKLLYFNTFQLGIMFDKPNVPKTLKLMSTFSKQQIKTQRIQEYLCQWVVQNQRYWHCYENQMLNLIIAFGHQVEFFLIQELCEEVRRIRKMQIRVDQ